MQPIATAVLFLAALLLELCWLGAWLTYVYAGLFERPFPLPDMLLAAALAALLVSVSALRNLRNIQVLALHGVCITGIWLSELQRLQADATSLIGGVLALSTAAFWTSGALHVRRTLTHRRVCERFDVGMYWLLALLGMRLLLRGEAQVPQQAELSDALVPCFFVNAVCAIAVSRYRSHDSKRWLRVAGRVSVLFATLCGLAVLGFSITWMCRPYLRALAETTHAGAASVARPIANAAAEVVLYIMRKGREHPPPLYLPGRMPAPYLGKRGEFEALEAVPADDLDSSTLWLITGVLMLIVGLSWAYRKRRWLWADQTPAAAHNEFWAMCLRLWRRALAWLQRATANRDPEPVRLLHALLVWGRRSGMTRESAETPLEYAARLKLSFAAMSGEIDSIVSSHCRHAYALAGCDDHELQRARRALSRLRSPRTWWIRSSTWWRARVASSPR